MMPVLIVSLGVLAAALAEPIAVRGADGRILYGDRYGSGDRGLVILAHGGYSHRASWSATAEAIAAAGLHVLVIESRAATDFASGKETPCLSDDVCQAADVIAAVKHLRRVGARSIALMGGSLGGAAVAHAAIDDGGIEAVVLLAPAAIPEPQRLTGRKMFVATASDANSSGLRLPGIKAQYARVAPPKVFVELEGTAHGQLIFATPQGAELTRAVIRFLLDAAP
ncbi:MAG TPA: alpha/beta hydrolase [Vicinamibacterales bacterium]|nr:alpha/beta hydrolase [Vicinamibacterales bacterium]